MEKKTVINYVPNKRTSKYMEQKQKKYRIKKNE